MNNRLFIGFVFILFYISGSVFARGRQELVKSGHWIYDSMAHIAIENGISDLSDRAPLTIGELEFILRNVDKDSLSESAKADYDRIYAYFDEDLIHLGTDYLKFSFDPEVSFSGFFKTEDDIDWTYNRYKRKPLFSSPVMIEAMDTVTMSMDVILGQNRGTMIRNDIYTNIPFEIDQTDNSFPETGYFSAGHTFGERIGVNFNIGLYSRSFQRSLMGNVFYSEYFTGATNANLTFYSPNFRYLTSVSEFNVDKYLYSHQFDIVFAKKFQFSAMESLLVNAPMELRFLNPWAVFHGAAPWRDYEPDEEDPESHTCCYMALKFAWTPVKGFRFYGGYGFDQYQLAYEKNTWKNDTTPNGVAASLGAESFVPFNEGFFHFWTECSYMDPFMYIKESPNWSLVRTYSENLGGKKIFYEWLGSPFGPDTIAAQLNAGYEVPGNWSVNLSYLFKASGEYAGFNVFEGTGWGGQKKTIDLASWVYPDSDNEGGQDYAKKQQGWLAPHGTVEYTNRLALEAGWYPRKNLYLMILPSFVVQLNHQNQEGEFACGFELAGCVSLRLLDLLHK